MRVILALILPSFLLLGCSDECPEACATIEVTELGNRVSTKKTCNEVCAARLSGDASVREARRVLDLEELRRQERLDQAKLNFEQTKILLHLLEGYELDLEGFESELEPLCGN